MKVIQQRMHRSRSFLAGVAILAVAALTLGGCAAVSKPQPTPAQGDLTLNIGTLFPLSGSNAGHGPSTTAAAALAAADINSAGAGITVKLVPKDEGDSTADTATKSVSDLLSAGVSAIVGPVSNGVAKQVIDQITSAGVVQVSPGNTSPDFTNYGDHGLYWRTAPSCVLEGSALGAYISQQGVKSLAIIDERGFCDASLGDAVAVSFQAGGGKVASRTSLEIADPGVQSKTAAVIAAKPDAVAVLGSQAAAVVPILASAGIKGNQLYLTGLSITNHAADFPAGSLTGAIASRPGPDLTTMTDFVKRLTKQDPTVTDFGYAAETYDAVVLLALGALAAQSTSGVKIASKLREVSGGTGSGTRSTDFATAAGLIRSGGVANYDGYSGPITFDEKGDPAGAIVGFYRYGPDNAFTRVN